MSYKTILVHVDESPRAHERINIAAAIATAESAHLIGTAPSGISSLLLQTSTLPELDPNLPVHLDLLRQRAERALQAFESAVQTLGVTSFEKRLVDDEASGGICLQARYADLVVIGQNNPDEPSPLVPPDFPQYVVLNCGRPVLLIPYAGHFEQVGKRVLIAWDASMQATRAITYAIPLLKRAQMVDIAIFNPLSHAHGALPGADIAHYLARHGVKVDVLQRKTRIDVSASLLSMAADQNSDLIVMGGYAHSRFREIMLGGVTRTMLETMTVPVLMSH
ncbi:MAG: universal stress protein [Noviherbaspirillum sp.]